MPVGAPPSDEDVLLNLSHVLSDESSLVIDCIELRLPHNQHSDDGASVVTVESDHPASVSADTVIHTAPRSDAQAPTLDSLLVQCNQEWQGSPCHSLGSCLSSSGESEEGEGVTPATAFNDCSPIEAMATPHPTGVVTLTQQHINQMVVQPVLNVLSKVSWLVPFLTPPQEPPDHQTAPVWWATGHQKDPCVSTPPPASADGDADTDCNPSVPLATPCIRLTGVHSPTTAGSPMKPVQLSFDEVGGKDPPDSRSPSTAAPPPSVTHPPSKDEPPDDISDDDANPTLHELSYLVELVRTPPKAVAAPTTAITSTPIAFKGAAGSGGDNRGVSWFQRVRGVFKRRTMASHTTGKPPRPGRMPTESRGWGVHTGGGCMPVCAGGW